MNNIASKNKIAKWVLKIWPKIASKAQQKWQSDDDDLGLNSGLHSAN